MQHRANKRIAVSCLLRLPKIGSVLSKSKIGTLRSFVEAPWRPAAPAWRGRGGRLRPARAAHTTCWGGAPRAGRGRGGNVETGAPAGKCLTRGRGERNITSCRFERGGRTPGAGKPRRPGAPPRAAHLERRILERTKNRISGAGASRRPRHNLTMIRADRTLKS